MRRISISRSLSILALVAMLSSLASPLSTASEVILPDSYSEAAFTDFITQLDLASLNKPNSNITFDLSPSLTKDQRNLIIEDVNLSGRFWAKQLNDVKILVLGSTTEDFSYLSNKLALILTPTSLTGGWLESKAEQAKLKPNSFHGGMAAGYSKNGQSVIGVYIPAKQNLSNGSILQTTSHEFTHIVQRELFKGNMSPMQCWVREGQAHYIGYHMAGRNSKAAFANYWVGMLDMVNPESGFTGVYKYSADDFTQWFINNRELSMVSSCDGIEYYVFGALAYEVLYGKFGSKSVNLYFANLYKTLDICKDGSDQYLKDCRVVTSIAFKDAFGIAEDEFYDLVGQHIYNSYRWAVKIPRLSDQEAAKIAPLPFKDVMLSNLKPPTLAITAKPSPIKSNISKKPAKKYPPKENINKNLYYGSRFRIF
jgi:hypothetical protein